MNTGLYPSGQVGLLNNDDDTSLDPSLRNTRMVIKDVKCYNICKLHDVLKQPLNRYKYLGMNRTRYHRHNNTNNTMSFSEPVHDDEEEVILLDIARRDDIHHARSFIRGGMRSYTVWAPNEVVAAIVTCGGLCPGLNDVIRETVYMLYYNYGVDVVYGIRNGLCGFYDDAFSKKSWTPLRVPDDVYNIHINGGTMLGSSRGGFDADKILNSCVKHGVNQIYITGGDGTHRAAYALAKHIEKAQLKISIAAIPKTIDNDIGLIDRSFGFNTAVERAQESIISAQVEASCTPNGIGIVKLMGRHSGFIAAHATMASRLVDVCLIPEIKFHMHGPCGVLQFVEKVLQARGHCVIVVAEGCSKHVEEESSDIHTDESGNLQSNVDIGEYFQHELRTYFKKRNTKISLKYHDPSYMIRSCKADASDSIYCLTVAQNAVYGSMAGYTSFSSCIVNNRSVYLPLQLIDRTSPVYINPTGRTWMRVLSSTHQPDLVNIQSKL